MPRATTESRPFRSPYGQAEWRALGTYVQLVVAGEHRLAEARTIASGLLADVDRTCSRFREDSDLVRANRNAGAWTRVDPLLVEAVATAVRAAEETDGRVDPTLGRSLVAAGYDQDFDAVPRDAGPVAIPVPAVVDAWREIGLDPSGAVLVPAGVALDLGATGKAFAADLIAARISARTGGGCVLSLGGDVAVGTPEPDTDGTPADPVPWRVTISETPDDPPDAMVTIPSGGLATSTVLARRWLRAGQVVHHLLDPATGRSVLPAWRTVSVRAATCVAANTATTAAVVWGEPARQWLADRGLAARLVDTSGEISYVGDWTEEAFG